MSKYTPVSGIYIIVNKKNNKVYIGQSQDLRRRLSAHRTKLNARSHRNIHLQRAWDKDGEKVFRFKVLEYCPIDQLDEREQHYLDIYMPKGICYNIAKDVTCPTRGVKASAETRHKLSESHKNKKLTPEQCRKMSEDRKGIPLSPEHRKKISDAKQNISEETREKLKIARHNRQPLSEESHRRMSEAAKKRCAKQKAKREKTSGEFT